MQKLLENLAFSLFFWFQSLLSEMESWEQLGQVELF